MIGHEEISRVASEDDGLSAVDAQSPIFPDELAARKTLGKPGLYFGHPDITLYSHQELSDLVASAKR